MAIRLEKWHFLEIEFVYIITKVKGSLQNNCGSYVLFFINKTKLLINMREIKRKVNLDCVKETANFLLLRSQNR